MQLVDEMISSLLKSLISNSLGFHCVVMSEIKNVQ